MNTDSPSFLHIDISKRFSDAFTLELKFELPAGFTVIFGPSGAGKTTLLECISGLLAPDKGTILLDNTILFDSRRCINIPVPRRAIGYVFQSLALFPHLTARQNIGYGLPKLDSLRRSELIDSIAENFRITHVLDRKPAFISGGEKQRVALARTLVAAPRLLLLDEPFSALDSDTKAAVLDDLRAWQKTHPVPVLLVTHSQEEALALSSNVMVLSQGRLTEKGRAQQILAQQ